MTETTEDYDNRVLGVLRRLGTSTANNIASRTKRKPETARRSLDRLTEKGLVYPSKSGRITYFTLMPDGKSKRIKPDRKKSGNDNEVYAHPSQTFPFHRANTRLEIIPEKGFVCHPEIKGIELDRQFIRCHFNGEYQVSIKQKGDMKSVDYLADTDIRLWWKKNGLNTNTSCICEIRVPYDPEPFIFRTVSGKDGKFKKASLWVHPRYIYHVDCTKIAQAEFEQQVKDVLGILNKTGWKFKEDIIRKGQPHHAINDPVLGSLVGNYNESPNDPLHFDHSHGISECEVYGDNPDVIEIMVHLPTLMKTLTNAMVDIQTQLATLLDIQTKQFQFLNNKIEPPISTPPVSNDNGMYQ